MTATVYAFANQKGGVGKTTSTLSVAAAMAEMGRAVLVVDLDPQACLTFSLGYDPDQVEPSLHDTVTGRTHLVDTIVQHGEVDLAPANIDLAGAEVTLLSRTGREYLLRGELYELLDSYDAVLVDCAPSLGVLTINGLTAADEVDHPGPVRDAVAPRGRPAARDHPRRPSADQPRAARSGACSPRCSTRGPGTARRSCGTCSTATSCR